MNLITREELKARLDRGDDFKLVMTLNEWAFQAKHIPGSLNIYEPEHALKHLSRDDEIVVYCASGACPAGQVAYGFLAREGYRNIWRYAGGLEDWEAAGHPLEGEMVEEQP